MPESLITMIACCATMGAIVVGIGLFAFWYLSRNK